MITFNRENWAVSWSSTDPTRVVLWSPEWNAPRFTVPAASFGIALVGIGCAAMRTGKVGSNGT